MADKETLPIRVKIAEKLGGLGPSIESAVIEHLANEEVEKKKTTLVVALDALTKMENAHRRLLKPDLVFGNSEGGDKVEAFTPGRQEEIKKSKEKIEKMERAITKALEKGDFGDVLNLTGNIKAEKQGGSQGEGAAD